MARSHNTNIRFTTKSSRGRKLRPFNLRKKEGPKSGWRGMRKRKRGQG